MKKFQTHITNRFINAVLSARWSSMNRPQEISPEAISTGGKFFAAAGGAAHGDPPSVHSNTPTVRQEIRVDDLALFTISKSAAADHLAAGRFRAPCLSAPAGATPAAAHGRGSANYLRTRRKRQPFRLLPYGRQQYGETPP